MRMWSSAGSVRKVGLGIAGGDGRVPDLLGEKVVMEEKGLRMVWQRVVMEEWQRSLRVVMKL